jgi:hypothetical protein
VKFDIPIFGDTPFEQITIESAIENALQAKNVSEGSTEAVSTEMVLTETVSIETSSTAVSIETSSTDVSIESSIESSAAAGVLTVGQSGNPSTGIEASVTDQARRIWRHRSKEHRYYRRHRQILEGDCRRTKRKLTSKRKNHFPRFRSSQDESRGTACRSFR